MSMKQDKDFIVRLFILKEKNNTYEKGASHDGTAPSSMFFILPF